MIVQIVYGLLFVLAMASALMVVLSPHAVYSALYLVATMVSIAGLFVLMNAQLAAMFQVIVYAGAIMVLFLFVIMLLNVGHQRALPLATRHIRHAGVAFALAFVAQLAIMIRWSMPTIPNGVHFPSISIRDLAVQLITKYVYAFEITSVLLLISVVGAIVLARRHLIQGTVEKKD